MTIQRRRVAVVGGGIAGCTAAIELSKQFEVDLYEKNQDILLGPPFCHLHAGGMLYPMISLEECKELLAYSVEFASMFHDCINDIPTVVAFNKSSRYQPDDLILKCKFIAESYTEMGTDILGDPKDYFSVYEYESIQVWKNTSKFQVRQPNDTFVHSFLRASNDLDHIKYPFVCVNEFGVDMDGVKSRLKSLLLEGGVNLFKGHRVDNLFRNLGGYRWLLQVNQNQSKKKMGVGYDLVVNACGYESVNLNHILQERVTYLEVKASWLIEVDQHVVLPEVAIIGERGTPNGMIQLTPHKQMNGRYIYQIHVMTNDVTLFPDGCMYENTVVHDTWPCPNLSEMISRRQLSDELIYERTHAAAKYVQKYFKGFDSYNIVSKPVWGVQRIVADSKDYRGGSLTFDQSNTFAEVNIVKGICSVSIARQLSQQLNSFNEFMFSQSKL